MSILNFKCTILPLSVVIFLLSTPVTGVYSPSSVPVLHQESPIIPAQNLVPLHYTTLGEAGEANGQFENPRGIYQNSTHILVADLDNDRIQIFDRNGGFVASFGSSGTGPGQFNSPAALTSNGSHYFVADSMNAEIDVFDLDSTYSGNLGIGGFSEDTIAQPVDIVSNGSHLFIADFFSQKINIHTTTGEFVRSFPSSLEGEDLATPTHVDINATHIFVSVNDQLRIYNHLGQHLTSITSPNNFSPSGLTFVNDLLVVAGDLSGTIELYRSNGDYVGEFGDSTPPSVELVDLNAITSNTTHVLVSDNFADQLVFIEVSVFQEQPILVSADAVGSGIQLEIGPPDLTGINYVLLTGYNIYRSDNGTYSLLAFSETTTFTDTAVEDGGEYSYIVTGVLESGETPSSTPLSAVANLQSIQSSSPENSEDSSLAMGYWSSFIAVFLSALLLSPMVRSRDAI